MSSLAWIDFDEAERQRAQALVGKELEHADLKPVISACGSSPAASTGTTRGGVIPAAV
mgnify:CR=1 FL=1